MTVPLRNPESSGSSSSFQGGPLWRLIFVIFAPAEGTPCPGSCLPGILLQEQVLGVEVCSGVRGRTASDLQGSVGSHRGTAEQKLSPPHLTDPPTAPRKGGVPRDGPPSFRAIGVSSKNFESFIRSTDTGTALGHWGSGFLSHEPVLLCPGVPSLVVGGERIHG